MAAGIPYNPFPETRSAAVPATPYQRINATPDQFGGSIARGLESVGQGAEKAGHDIFDAAMAKQMLTNEVSAAETDTWLSKQITDKWNDYGRLQGKAAQDALPQFKSDVEDLYKQAVGNAPSDDMKARVAKSGRFLTNSYYRYATNHADSQWRSWADKTASNRADELGNQAVLARDYPEERNTFLAGSDDEVRKRLEMQGWDKETIDVETKKNRGANVARLVREKANQGDGTGALDLFKEYTDQIDGRSRVDIGNFLRPYLQRRNGQQIGDTALGRTQDGSLPQGMGARADLAADRAGIDATVLRRIVKIESGGNPNATRGSYKGLGQLSDEEFQKHGGGDIYNADHNLRATANKIAAESARFEQQYGRPASATDIYMVHQQGAGGYAAHLANPDAPAWQNMASTLEGRRKGDGWARAAIWGNIPDQDKANFPGGVDSVTSAQFVSLWQRRVDGAGSGLPDKGQAYGRARELAGGNPEVERIAIDHINKAYTSADSDAALNQYQAKQFVDSDVQSTLVTGQGVQNFDAARVSNALGPVEYAKYAASKRNAYNTWRNSHDMWSLPDEEIDRRLAEVEPRGGEPDYAERMTVYNNVRERAQAVREQRVADPAASVDADQNVRAARAALNPKNPDSMKALGAARMAAQQVAGVPEDNRSPITKEEALKLTQPLRYMLPGDEKDTLTEIATNFQKLFGENADVAFAYALRANKVQAQTAQVAARVVKKLGLGQDVTPEDSHALSTAGELGASERAMQGNGAGGPSPQVDMPSFAGMGMGDPTVPYIPMQGVPIGAANQEEKRGQNIPAGAIRMLRQKPDLANQFDSKFGKGSAQKILEAYPVR